MDQPYYYKIMEYQPPIPEILGGVSALIIILLQTMWPGLGTAHMNYRLNTSHGGQHMTR